MNTFTHSAILTVKNQKNLCNQKTILTYNIFNIS